MSDFITLAVGGCLAAAHRHDAADTDVLAVGRSLAEVLFWWRALEEQLAGSKRAEPNGVGPDLSGARPGLIWARNLSTHHDLTVEEVVGLQWPRAYPLDYEHRVIWRWPDELPPPHDPKFGPAQVESYRQHLAGQRTARAIGLIREWVESIGVAGTEHDALA